MGPHLTFGIANSEGRICEYYLDLFYLRVKLHNLACIFRGQGQVFQLTAKWKICFAGMGILHPIGFFNKLKLFWSHETFFVFWIMLFYIIFIHESKEHFTVPRVDGATVVSARGILFLQSICALYIKGALDKYNIIPQLPSPPPKKRKSWVFDTKLELLSWVMNACWVLSSRLTYFWRNMNIPSIFYFSKSISRNTQYSSLYGTLWRWCCSQNTS